MLAASLVVILVAMITFAILDLWVGVANDAVNFLNSALGARVATRRMILAVASVGVAFGAMVSTGMMEVARKGVFDPSRFTDDTGHLILPAILAVYLGVIAADVVLLDLFNSFGLPTSTTVSIISELAGASIAVSFWLSGMNLREALGVINTGPLLGIYSGIFLSVVVSFSVGALVMFLARLLLTHDLGARFRALGWIWVSVSFVSLTYFVLLKGLKQAAFLDEATTQLLYRNVGWILGGVAIVSAVAAVALARHYRAVFTVIILAGTCSLAIAFAGNDLVNFIGPTVAAAQAILIPGVNLSGKVPTPEWALIAAGLVMVAALWRSKKARRVTDTEIRLAAQGDARQRFQGNRFAAAIVSWTTTLHSLVNRATPASLRRRVDQRTRPPVAEPGEPPYDLLRASVNLTVASLLISIGTLNKLPLSTTYITFMVAMGAALADRRWESSSAEQRVAGILTVVGGWVLTGVIAATGGAIAASIIFTGGTVGVAIVIGLVLVALVRMARGRYAEESYG